LKLDRNELRLNDKKQILPMPSNLEPAHIWGIRMSNRSYTLSKIYAGLLKDF